MMNHSKILKAFFCREFYDHPVDHIKLLETHISLIFLTGHFAYKIKKPVDFGFLNFTTIERRRFFCEEELRLNSRFAPQIYLEVLSVNQIDNHLCLSGQGDVVDYVIKMNQFDQNCLFNNLLFNKQLALSHIDELIHVVADFHQKINIASSAADFGSIQEVIKPVEENFSVLQQIPLASNDQKILTHLHKQLMLMFAVIKPYLLERKKQGYIRECHGDLHLGNITIIDKKVVLFDGIEFNDSFRWIDTMSDCAFLIMDLQDHERMLFANHFLNGYLWASGDYYGLNVLKFYKVYRAMVRAKVAALRLQQQTKTPTDYKKTLSGLRRYLQLAQGYLATSQSKNQTFLAISFGLSGSGKSSVCAQLADQLNAIQISSDVERKRLFLNKTNDLYSKQITAKTYMQLLKIATQILNAGFSVIVDATFLDKVWREKFYALAREKQIPFHIIAIYAEQHILKKRLLKRQYEKNVISDADINVMKKQSKKTDCLSSKEKKYEILINTGLVSDLSAVVSHIQRSLL